MAKKQLAINMTANFVAFLVQFGINFFFTPYLIRTVGKEAYSFFPLASSFIGYAGIITVALNSMASRFITIRIQQNDTEGANIYMNSVLYGNTIMAVALTIPSVFILLFLNNILNIPAAIFDDIQWLFGLVMLSMILNIQLSVFGVATYATNRLDLSSLRNAESNILRVILLVLMFYFFRPSVVYIGIANLVVAAFILMTNVYYTKKLLPQITFDRKFFRLGAIKELLGAGVWNSINQLSIVLMSNLDLLIANIYLGASITGELAIVKTVPIFINTIIITLVSVFAPEFTILYAKNKTEELIQSIKTSLKFMSSLMTLPIGFLLIMGSDFFTLWVPGQDSSMLFILSNLTLVPMIISTSIETLFHVFSVTNKLKTPSIVFVLSGVVNVLLIIGLLKYTNIGVYAIPIVGMVSAVLQHSVFTPIYAAKSLKVNPFTFHFAIVRGLLNCGIMMLVTYLLSKVIFQHDWKSFVFLAFVSSVITLIINMLIFFSREEKITFAKKLKLIKK
ncbi:MAG: hypothetical protein ACOYOT_01530 [Bacteroidales bacterium]